MALWTGVDRPTRPAFKTRGILSRDGKQYVSASQDGSVDSHAPESGAAGESTNHSTEDTDGPTLAGDTASAPSHSASKSQAAPRSDSKGGAQASLDAQFVELQAQATDASKRRSILEQQITELREQLERQQASMMAEAAHLEEAEIASVFERIDLDRSGTIDRTELAEVAKSLGKELTMAELNAAMKEMDGDGRCALIFMSHQISVLIDSRALSSSRSGEVDRLEFTQWFHRQKNDSKSGGLFGGLFSDPLALSDTYVQLTISLRKKESLLKRVRCNFTSQCWCLALSCSSAI
eukprot:SAG31_NODE_1966_length_6786_cov_7.109167_5_plen_293_part_00